MYVYSCTQGNKQSYVLIMVQHILTTLCYAVIMNFLKCTLCHSFIRYSAGTYACDSVTQLNCTCNVILQCWFAVGWCGVVTEAVAGCHFDPSQLIIVHLWFRNLSTKVSRSMIRPTGVLCCSDISVNGRIVQSHPTPSLKNICRCQLLFISAADVYHVNRCCSIFFVITPSVVHCIVMRSLIYVVVPITA